MSKRRDSMELSENGFHQSTTSWAEAPGASESLTVSESSPSSGLNTQEVLKLVGVFEPSISFLLLHTVKLLTASKRKPSVKEEEAVKMYKQVYSKLLRADKAAPLLHRVALCLELLDQLALQVESRDSRVSP